MKLQAALGIATLWVGFAAAAHATTVYVLFDSAYSTPVRVDRTVDGGATWYQQDPGQFHFITQPGSPSYIPADFYTFCIEPREFLTPGQLVTYNEVPLSQGTTNIGGMGTTKANLILELLYRNLPNVNVAVNTTVGAAIQVAIWELVREDHQTVGTYNLGTGDVQYRNWNDTAVRDLAQGMLNGLTGNGPYAQNINALAAVGVQDIFVDPPTPTPEPGTLLLSGAALLVLGGLRPRKPRA
jgi:hypothetical protein